MKKSKEATHQMTLRIPMSLYDQMRKALDASGLLTTEFILRAIKEKLNSDDAEPQPADAEPVTRAEIRKIIQEELRASTKEKRIAPLQRL